MMNHETELQLQAHLDGELAAGEARAINMLLERDVEARALFEELNHVKSLVSGNEMEMRTPETREFYWSKIRRQIERESLTQDGLVAKPTYSVLLRFLAPVSALAALSVIVTLSFKVPSRSTSGSTLASLEDPLNVLTEMPLQETSSFSFRSESAGMTVVWVDSHRN